MMTKEKKERKEVQVSEQNIEKESLAFKMLLWWLAELDIYAFFAEGILDNKHNAWGSNHLYSISNQNVRFL